jgi:hypothetical protein
VASFLKSLTNYYNIPLRWLGCLSSVVLSATAVTIAITTIASMTLFPFTLDRKRLTETGYEIRLPSLSPGAANPYSSCFHKALWRGQRYLVGLL